jgi:hypothetical protein
MRLSMKLVCLLPIFFVFVLLNGPPEAFADDRKAARSKLGQAYKLYQKQPKRAAALTRESIKLSPNYLQARKFLAWLYNVSLGELENAVVQYDWIIKNAKKRKDKAEAMAEKGSIIFVLKNDAKATIKLYNQAYDLFRNWNYRDKAANLALHIKNVDKALIWGEQAQIGLEAVIDRAHESKAFSKKQKKQKLAQLEKDLIKVKLLIATCHLLKKNKMEADALMKGITTFDLNHQYNLALYHAADGFKEPTLKALTTFVKNRKSVKARNQSRDFIETEPLFRKFVETEAAFKELIKREKEK